MHEQRITISRRQPRGEYSVIYKGGGFQVILMAAVFSLYPGARSIRSIPGSRNFSLAERRRPHTPLHSTLFYGDSMEWRSLSRSDPQDLS